MLPTLQNLYRMNLMACTTPCKSCTCDSVYDSDYVEGDPSPLATASKKFLTEQENSPAGFLDRFCKEEPGAPECKIHEV